MSFTDLPRFAPRQEAPYLVGDDVVLRAHTLGDFDLFWEFYQNSARTTYISSPDNTTHLWYGMGAEISSWQLHGIGAWAIEAGGKMAGQICIAQQPRYPEIEIGWILFDGFEGRSIGYKAARLALDWFWANIDHPSLVSYIMPENARSIALAVRLGATHDARAKCYDDEDLVFRHLRPAS